MPTILKHRQMVITLHASREDGVPDTYVQADVLRDKLSTFLSALREADKATTAPGAREIYVSYLKTGSAEIGFRETEITKSPDASSFDTFQVCARAVMEGDTASASRYNGLLNKMERLGKGAGGKKLSHISVSLENANPIRVDAFFHRQAARMVKELKGLSSVTPYFKGAAEEALDGTVKEVDLRGTTPLCKLVLSGSGNQIDCTFENFDIPDIKEMLNRRGWMEGIGIYDGFSGLPERFEIRSYRAIKATGDPGSWKGQLKAENSDGWLEFEGID